MHWSWYISGGLILLYAVRILSFLAGWKRCVRRPAGVSGKLPRVSVVVPVRNEAEGIVSLLEDLARQDYPDEQYEVIIVDDRSTDRTAEISGEFIRDLPHFHLKYSPASGKKAALHAGIRASEGNLILTTDGDCRMGERWIVEMVREFSAPGARLVFGAVALSPRKGWFRKMQSLEQAALTGIAAGAAGIHRPILCNAANLAFYREDYLAYRSETPARSPSGDDIFLLLWIKKKWPGAIRFTASAGSLVSTKPAGTAREFFNQRIRWTSKSRHYRDRDIIATAVLVYLVNFLLLAGAAACIAGLYPCLLFLTCFSVKSLTDLVLLFSILGHYRDRKLLALFLPLEIIYFVYVSITGLAGQVMPYTWKHRRSGAIHERRNGESVNAA